MSYKPTTLCKERELRKKAEQERDEARTTIEDAKRALNATDYEGILLAAMRVKEERDEARAVANALADTAFKYLTSLLASTPNSTDAAHDEETQEVIAAIKQWKELKR